MVGRGVVAQQKLGTPWHLTILLQLVNKWDPEHSLVAIFKLWGSREVSIASRWVRLKWIRAGDCAIMGKKQIKVHHINLNKRVCHIEAAR